jgi:hypothetical protein
MHVVAADEGRRALLGPDEVQSEQEQKPTEDQKGSQDSPRNGSRSGKAPRGWQGSGMRHLIASWEYASRSWSMAARARSDFPEKA